MRIDVTVRDEAGNEQDLAVMSRTPVRLGDLRARVAALADGEVWSGDRLVSDTTELGGAGLRHGAVLAVGRPSAMASRALGARLQVIGGPDAGLTCDLSCAPITVGRAAECTLVLSDPDVSRRHLAVGLTGRTAWVRDEGSTNGTRVGGRAVGAGPEQVRLGELIRLGDSFLELTPDAAPTDETPAALRATATGALLVNRPPRMHLSPAARVVIVPERPVGKRPGGVRLLGALAPALAGVVLATVLDSPQYLLFAVLSPLTMLATALGDRLHWRRDRRRTASAYRGRSATAQAEIASGLAAETALRRARHPDPATLLRIATLHDSRLWLRGSCDDDAFTVRLGLGSADSALQTRVGAEVGSAGRLCDVPAVASLRDGPIGLAAPDGLRSGVARWIVAQLAVLHSPADVEIGLLLSDSTDAAWRWARWLPHLRAGVACNPAERAEFVAGLVDLADQRYAEVRPGQTWSGRWLVIVLDRAGDLVELPGLAGVLAVGASVGITAICVDGSPEHLPTACASVAAADGEAGTRVRLRHLLRRCTDEVVADRVSVEWCESLARGLAPLVDAGADSEAAIPDTCRLVDVLDIRDTHSRVIRSRWAHSDGRPSTSVGVGVDGAVSIDLVRDGPHALIAGTTGAGKSELLQSLVAGLAADHPPSELAFVLVDYKGGAAFGECARLPTRWGWSPTSTGI